MLLFISQSVADGLWGIPCSTFGLFTLLPLLLFDLS